MNKSIAYAIFGEYLNWQNEHENKFTSLLLHEDFSSKYNLGNVGNFVNRFILETGKSKIKTLILNFANFSFV